MIPSAAHAGTRRLRSSPMAKRSVPIRLPMTNTRNTQIPQASAWVSSITAANSALVGSAMAMARVLKPLLRTAK